MSNDTCATITTGTYTEPRYSYPYPYTPTPYPYWQPYIVPMPFYTWTIQPDPKVAELEKRVQELERKLNGKAKTTKL